MAKRAKWVKYSFGTDEIRQRFGREINEDKSFSFCSSESLMPLIEVLTILFWQFIAKNAWELGITDKSNDIGGRYFVVDGKIVRVRILFSDVGNRQSCRLNCIRKPYLIEVDGNKVQSGKIFRILEVLLKQHGFIGLKAIAAKKLKKEDKERLGKFINFFYDL